ncbi:hypothetical protein EKE94_00720 [Mesobaculum littorinae]|uniref:Uncharacterized protein n=1 Tax=Mesobaculum littorinae TaxID=2486419 RepID=A0A438AKT5_9RHOB|nr:hypothetical protein [Mesobaculum littorinae]RVV99254.1 hypothetical protein EKE94_00720 [Mesobaculum littorinae]
MTAWILGTAGLLILVVAGTWETLRRLRRADRQLGGDSDTHGHEDGDRSGDNPAHRVSERAGAADRHINHTAGPDRTEAAPRDTGDTR